MIQLGPDKALATRSSQGQPVILVVTCNGHLTEAVMGYSLNVAGRLKHRLLVAYVNTMPFLWESGFRNRRFALVVKENFGTFQERSKKRGITVSHIRESGNISRVVSRLCRIVKKIEFIIVDDSVSVEKVVSRACVPVFSVDKLVKA